MTTIYSSNQTDVLNHNFFQPTGEIHASLLIVHGMAEYGGRYADFAEFLATQGIAVLTYDHLGHGNTAQSVDTLGFFTQDNPMQAVIDDTLIMSHALTQEYPDVPQYIMGHSMGSFIVRNVLKTHSKNFAGAIVMGTADKDPLANLLLPVFTGLNNIAPTHRSSVFSALLNGVINSKSKNKQSASKFAWVSANQDNVSQYEQDPLCGFNFTNNGYCTLFGLMKGALNQPWYDDIARDFPLMIVSGEDDPVGNMGKGINALAHRLQQKQFNQVKKILYPAMRHEILNEIDNNIVYNDISHWILASAT